ncbi:MAG: hypothetical protein V2A63_01625 [Patescibacteria group bacterium]
MANKRINLARRLVNNFNLIENPNHEQLKEELRALIQECLMREYTLEWVRSQWNKALNTVIDWVDKGKKRETRTRLNELFNSALASEREKLAA